jgi:hypothetical protein
MTRGHTAPSPPARRPRRLCSADCGQANGSGPHVLLGMSGRARGAARFPPHCRPGCRRRVPLRACRRPVGLWQIKRHPRSERAVPSRLHCPLLPGNSAALGARERSTSAILETRSSPSPLLARDPPHPLGPEADRPGVTRLRPCTCPRWRRLRGRLGRAQGTAGNSAELRGSLRWTPGTCAIQRPPIVPGPLPQVFS